MRKQCAKFHFASLCLLIFHAKLLRFIDTRVSAIFAGLFSYCISRLYYLLKRIFFIPSLVTF